MSIHLTSKYAYGFLLYFEMSFNLDAFGAIQAKASALPPRRKPPKHRHATPSGPWPFLDIDDEVDSTQLSSPPPQPKFDDEEERENYGPVFDSRPYWSHYPQSQFANWTQWQQNKSGIARVVNRRLPLPEDCRIFKLDIWSDGIFRADNVRSEEGDYVVKSGRVGSREVAESIENFWQVLGEKVCRSVSATERDPVISYPFTNSLVPKLALKSSSWIISLVLSCRC